MALELQDGKTGKIFGVGHGEHKREALIDMAQTHGKVSQSRSDGADRVLINNHEVDRQAWNDFVSKVSELEAHAERLF